MCGIAGFVSKDELPNYVIEQMTDVMEHRGPDAAGHYNLTNLSLGHCRLAIVDLSSSGHQPMEYMDRYVITYNGEIYNYIEIKDALKQLGYVFKNETDTEVILAAYDKWGEKCLDKFNGMWAFAIYDKLKETLFISRDRFGIKPLYYYQDERNFIFASEIKALLQHPSLETSLNEKYITDYLEIGPREYVKATPFESIYRYPFATYTSSKRENLFRPLEFTKYWSAAPNLTNEKFSQKSAEIYAQKYYDLLYDAVKIRLRADVRVGSALSGGLDSSSIVFLINQELSELGKTDRQETFSNVYTKAGTEDCDESSFISVVSQFLKVNSNTIEPNQKDVPLELPKIIRIMETPPETTCMSGWYTFKKVKECGVTVTLDGQGADEQLAGYNRYIPSYLLSLSSLNFYSEISHFFQIPGYRKKVFATFILFHAKLLLRKRLFDYLLRKLNKDPKKLDLNFFLYHDFQTSLVNLIHYSDRVSMGHSIESRMPFMDYRLVEFLAELPACYKMHKGWTKYIARLAFSGKLPADICWRKDKMGWPIPEAFWFRGKLKKWFLHEISLSNFLTTEEKNLTEVSLNGNKPLTKLIRRLNVALFEKEFFNKR